MDEIRKLCKEISDTSIRIHQNESKANEALTGLCIVDSNLEQEVLVSLRVILEYKQTRLETSQAQLKHLENAFIEKFNL